MLELRARIDAAAELAEEKRWAARKEHLFAVIFSGNATEAVRDFESWRHPSVLEGEVRRYEAAVKQAVAANRRFAQLAALLSVRLRRSRLGI